MAFLGGLFGSAPPNPQAVAQAQYDLNVKTAQQQQKQNMIGQTTPYGTLSYVPDPSSPSGYRAVQALSAPEQQILAGEQGGQIGAGGAATALGGQLAGLYGQPANLDPSAVTNQMMNWQTQSMQPYWDIQQSNLQSQLANQGLNPNDPAYQNAMMAFTKGIGQARNQFFAQDQPLAFQEMLQQYQLPLQTEQSLLGMAQPQMPNLVNTPQGQIQPPNYQGAAYQSWADQQARNQAAWSDIAKLAGAAGSFAGGWG